MDADPFLLVTATLTTVEETEPDEETYDKRDGDKTHAGVALDAVDHPIT